MGQISIETVMAIAVPVVAVIVWLVRLEGRVNMSDSRHSDIISRLVRIETKLDQSNGRH